MTTDHLPNPVAIPELSYADTSELVDTLRRAQARCENLEIALKSNRTIGMALGLIMAAHGLDESAAFAALVKISQESNIRLHTLAERMIVAHAEETRSRRD